MSCSTLNIFQPVILFEPFWASGYCRFFAEGGHWICLSTTPNRDGSSAVHGSKLRSWFNFWNSGLWENRNNNGENTMHLMASFPSSSTIDLYQALWGLAWRLTLQSPKRAPNRSFLSRLVAAGVWWCSMVFHCVSWAKEQWKALKLNLCGICSYHFRSLIDRERKTCPFKKNTSLGNTVLRCTCSIGQ